MSKIPVMEIFGPTIQGEGMVIGQKTMFVRTAGCDYSCSWCDSSFTWDGTGKEQIRQMDAEEIWNELKAIGGEGFSFVTISGGNPALLKNLGKLIALLKKENIKLCLETQGSRWQDWFYSIDELTISPKPPSSGMKTDFEILDDIFKRLADRFTHQVSLKVVIFDENDFEYSKEVMKRYPGIPFYLQAGNENLSAANNDEFLTEQLKKYSWLIEKAMLDDELKEVRVLPQLHTFVWGNKRGV
ncbi:7-carboxy-7-deazaguanine synthase QueE [Bacillus infantis]|jgi:7-carboxy-7-deazaguanine synthase|uniref:7-carboxy-7-deazaguanine synthase QueE n=1 Tax=Bacillus infantis TaxID=324767 RepID=UPI00215507DB|nr:7-carboxy-7-deazaguanine synthase QueE [Bacillus infantis]MCR6611038.1 7-carboxy-7-deazaguanine synthase QueE [Bacillus infantis]